jgi:hypothetical protein
MTAARAFGGATLSPEWQFLLRACAMPHAGNPHLNLADSLSAMAIDWKRVVEHATQHDLGPRVYDSLRTCELPGPDASEALTTLRAQYYATGLRNRVLFDELETLLGEFQKAGVQALVLKGAALAATIHRSPAVRPMRDLDLMVARADMPVVEAILRDRGYALDDNQRDCKDWYYRHHYHLTFHRKRAVPVPLQCEVHWRLDRPSEPFTFDVDAMWARAATTTIGGNGALMLSAEDLLLHLCVHACKHRLTGGFRAICDVADVIRTHGDAFDWDALQERALTWRISEFVWVPLALSARLLDAAVPMRVLDALRPPDAERLLDAATVEVLHDRVAAALFESFFSLCYSPSLRGRLLTARSVFASQGASTSQHGLRRFRHYPRRARHVLRAYGRQLWQFSRQRTQAATEMERRQRLAKWLAPFVFDQPGQ